MRWVIYLSASVLLLSFSQNSRGDMPAEPSSSRPARFSSSRPAPTTASVLERKGRTERSRLSKLSEMLKRFRGASAHEKKELLRRLIGSLPDGYRECREVALLAARLLFDKNQEVKLLAGELLAQLGPSFFYLYRPALSSGDKKARWAATYALSRLSKHTSRTRRALLLMTRARYFRTRWQAVWGLGQLPELSTLEMAVLFKILLRDREGSVRIAAAKSLERARGKAVIVWLNALAKDPLAIVRWESFRQVVRWAGEFQPIRKQLIRAIGRESDPFYASEMAALFIERLLPLLRRDELSALLRVLSRHSSERVRVRAVDLARKSALRFPSLCRFFLRQLSVRDRSEKIRRLAKETLKGM